MNGNSDNHRTPLSREELFRLLDASSPEQAPGDELDDFEREAFEGFSAHTTAEKAREMVQEVHQRMDESLNSEEAKRTRPKWLWYAAAASVALLIVFSGYLMTRQAATQDLALNRDSKKMPDLPMPALEESVKESVTESTPEVLSSSATVAEEAKEKNSVKPFSEPLAAKRSGVADDPMKDRMDQSPQGDVRDQKKLEKEEMPLQTTTAVAAETMSDQKGVVSDADLSRIRDEAAYVNALSSADTKLQEQDKTRYGIVSPAPATVSENPTRFYKKKASAVETNEEILQKTRNTSTKRDDLKSEALAPGAYYKGGEPALKQDILKWFAAHQKPAPVGTFQVQVRIASAGKAAEVKLGESTELDATLREALREALMALNGWVGQGDKSVPADDTVRFELRF